MVRVKACGITSLKDALKALECGCDALGFVFYKKSPRYIAPQKAREIIKKLPRKIYKIGVFVNSPKEEVERVSRYCRLDMAQLHGEESAEYCRRLKGCRVIKAFRIKKAIRQDGIKGYPAFAYLFDTYSKSKPGGTGKSFDWKLLRALRKIKKPVFLAGGLTAENVARAIQEARPAWVDVSTGVESSPGRKSSAKLKRFIKAVKEKNVT